MLWHSTKKKDKKPHDAATIYYCRMHFRSWTFFEFEQNAANITGVLSLIIAANDDLLVLICVPIEQSLRSDRIYSVS